MLPFLLSKPVFFIRRSLAAFGLLISAAALAQTALPVSGTGLGSASAGGATNFALPGATPAMSFGGGAEGSSPAAKALLSARVKALSATTDGEGRKPEAKEAKEASLAEAMEEQRGTKLAKLDEIEFQRFVLSATGQALSLYGYELFAKPSAFAPAQAAPVPAAYILGAGDEVVVQVNGLVEINDKFVIDRDGRIMLPRVGPLNLAGVALSDVEKVMTAHIGKVYRNFTVSVTLGRLRSIEVFVVGQARKPGKYVISSMSGLVNALLETGGPGSNGSMRAIQLRRAGKTVATLDLYAFLSQGDNSADVQLLSGDIVYIPPAGPRAAVLGTINAPAIYELRSNETIAQVLALSGGLPTLAAPQKAQLERVDANRDIARYVEDFALDAAGQKLVLKGGDILTVFQISPQIANVVTVQGNVAAPLRYTHRPGMRVADLLGDKRLLIPGSYWTDVNQGARTSSYSTPEVNLDYATIQRLDPVALRTKTIAFNLAKAVNQDPSENLELLSGDIVTVYAADEPGAETDNSVTLTGDLVGGTKRFVWREGFTIKDIIPSTQWLVDYYGYWQRAAKLGRKRDNLRQEALVDGTKPAAKLQSPGMRDTGAGDRLLAASKNEFAVGDLASGVEPRSTKGQAKPALRDAADESDTLELQSGALRSFGQEINWNYAQVLRRVPATLQTKSITFNLGRAVIDGQAADNIKLEAGDQVALFTTAQVAVPTEKRSQMVTLTGEVAVPGKYQLQAGDTLPDLIKRAGGLGKYAFAYGTVFTRESTRLQQQDNLNKSVRRMRAQVDAQIAALAQNATDIEKSATVQAQIAGQQQLLKRMEEIKATGRVALDLDADRPDLPAIALEDGDVITVPQRPSFVGVFGEVYSESALIHKPQLSVGDYLDKAGITRDADLDNLIVVRADGTVEGSGNSNALWSRSALWGAGFQDKKLNPGDSVFVPSVVDRRTAYSLFIQGAKDWTSLIYQFALGAAAFKTLRN
jgi:protein involved in polysaccharide export with SLBB domain